MLHGRYVEVVTSFSDPLDLGGRVREGYLHVAWRDGADLKGGYLLVREGEIVGAIAENILQGEVLKGEKALNEILTAVRKGLIKAVEIYEANVDEILEEHPSARVEVDDRGTSGERDINSLLLLLREHRGNVEVRNGPKAWGIYVEKGRVKAARTLAGSGERGDRAVKEMLREMGKLVRDGDVLLEGLELLREKQRIEKGF